ncbi:MAG: gloB 1 [Deltaproteobacteria bacterium]|nr:gloB 1 [Deltaproteobacteria bacterium]
MRTFGRVLVLLAFLGFLFADSQLSLAQWVDSAATKMLKARSDDLREDIVKVTDGVYTSVGHDVSTVSMIIGKGGIVIIDTGMIPEFAEKILIEFRKITDQPIKGIIYTHGHGDHTGGSPVFARNADPEIWARSNFGAEQDAFEGSGLTINNRRGARQAGFSLPPEQRINNGIAPVRYPKQGGTAFLPGTGLAKPNRLFSEDRKTIEIASVRMELVAAPGETSDALYVWLPDKKLLFAGDNFYASWPNLYAIRGTSYRDIRSWGESNDKMLKEGAEVLVPGHTRPILGKEAVAEALTNYRDAIRFVFNKTIEGMNKWLTPDVLVDYVKLPPNLAEKDYLREYYGNVQWAVRSIFNGALGWFDGNPTRLFPLAPKEQAKRLAALAGGADALLAKARQAASEKDYPWAAELCDHLLALDPTAREPKLIKADALTALGEALLTATGRNYYLTVAQELRQEVNRAK